MDTGAFYQSEINQLGTNLQDINELASSATSLKEQLKAAKELKQQKLEVGLEAGAGAVKAMPSAIGNTIRMGGKAYDIGKSVASKVKEATTRSVAEGDEAVSEVENPMVSRSLRMNYKSGGEGSDMTRTSGAETEGGVEMRGGVEESKGEVGAMDEPLTTPNNLAMDASVDADLGLGGTPSGLKGTVDVITKDPALGETAGDAGATAGEVAAGAGAEAGLETAATGAATAAAVEGGLNPIADVVAGGLALAGVGMTLKDVFTHKHDHSAAKLRHQQNANIQDANAVRSSLNSGYHANITGGMGDVRRPLQGSSGSF